MLVRMTDSISTDAAVDPAPIVVSAEEKAKVHRAFIWASAAILGSVVATITCGLVFELAALYRPAMVATIVVFVVTGVLIVRAIGKNPAAWREVTGIELKRSPVDPNSTASYRNGVKR